MKRSKSTNKFSKEKIKEIGKYVQNKVNFVYHCREKQIIIIKTNCKKCSSQQKL